VDVSVVILSKARANRCDEADRSNYEGRHRCTERAVWLIRFWENAPLPKMVIERKHSAYHPNVVLKPRAVER
jgi:hypothetical protein